MDFIVTKTVTIKFITTLWRVPEESLGPYLAGHPHNVILAECI